LGVLIHLIGPQLRELCVTFYLDVTMSAPAGPVDPELDFLALIANRIRRYNLTIDCSSGEEISEPEVTFPPIFTNRLVSSIPPSQITTFNLISFDSHFGKQAVGQQLDFHDSYDAHLDFTVPSNYEKDLISALEGMANLTSLHLAHCILSSHFARAYSFTLVDLKVDTYEPQCSHDDTAVIAISLARANQATLRQLHLKSLDLTKVEPIQLPQLRALSLSVVRGSHKALNVFRVPKLATLSYKNTRFQPSYISRALREIGHLPALILIRIERSMDFSKLRQLECANFLSACAAQGIRLELYNPGSANYQFKLWDQEGHLSMLGLHLRAVGIQIAAPPGSWAAVSRYTMPHLTHLRLSFSSTSHTTASMTATEYALASEYLLPFLEKLEAPLLEALTISFSTPFIDYLQGFARFIESKAFSNKFPRCTTISGHITADSATLWNLPKGPAIDPATGPQTVKKLETVKKPVSV
jgi:hypothetical protein